MVVWGWSVIPANGGILWGSVLANFQPGPQETWVDYHNTDRAPLLFVSGSEDHIMPPAIQRSNLKHYRSTAVTEIREYEGYAHLLPAQSGWEQIADACCHSSLARAFARWRSAPPRG